ncbi:MAG: hypothetical protein DCC63_14765 [Nitrospira sp.]|nr:MAG: hypothetical protein DCC63_14765 [Nitrospira sp.]
MKLRSIIAKLIVLVGLGANAQEAGPAPGDADCANEFFDRGWSRTVHVPPWGEDEPVIKGTYAEWEKE